MFMFMFIDEGYTYRRDIIDAELNELLREITINIFLIYENKTSKNTLPNWNVKKNTREKSY